MTIQRLSTNYIICSERLYRRLYDGIYLLCVTAKEAQQIIEKVHESHVNAHMLSRKIMRQGYYWTFMEVDCAAHVQKCHQYQVHGDFEAHAANAITYHASPWPFST